MACAKNSKCNCHFVVLLLLKSRDVAVNNFVFFFIFRKRARIRTSLKCIQARLIFCVVILHRVSKNSQTCFWHNFVKFPPTLIVFSTIMTKTILLCTVHSFTTSPNLYQRTTVWNRCSKLLQYAAIICNRWFTFASSARQRVRRALIILRYYIFYAENSRQQNSWLISLKHV